jgi:exodeoxyribonuclease-5
VILCGYRKTRVKLNAAARTVRGFVGPDPLVGETVICLANAVIAKGRSEGEPVFNGLCGIVRKADRGRREMVVEVDDGRELHVRYFAPQFGAEETADPRTAGRTVTLWDWGYALTCHRSQGSSYHTVAVYDECHPQWDGVRWRYTASTRASEKLIWVKP